MVELYKKVNNMKEEITRIKKIPFVKKFFKELTPSLELQIINTWLKKAKVFSNYLENSEIDSMELFAIADILHKKREEDIALLRYSRNAKKGYDDAKEFLQFLNEYTEGKIVLTGIRFDFKRVFDKENNRKSVSDLKSGSSSSSRVKGNKMIEGILTTLLEGKIKEKTKVFESYKSTPMFKKDEYPNKKPEFIRKHNRIATKEISAFFDKYQEISIKQRKIYTMKVLVFIKFLDSHEKYLKHAIEKKVKRKLVENEYYLQRFTEFTR